MLEGKQIILSKPAERTEVCTQMQHSYIHSLAAMHITAVDLLL